MKEIKKLDDKYLVIKKQDLEDYFAQFTKGKFTTEKERRFIDHIPFNVVLEEIEKRRSFQGKGQNKYLVLNLEDEFDVIELRKSLYNKDSLYENKIKHIAIDVVNSILKSKETAAEKRKGKI